MTTDIDFVSIHRRLARRDAVLRSLMRTHGPFALQANPDGFAVLAKSIISQQISTRAALAIGGRVVKAMGRGGLKPKNVLAATDDALRGAGLSANKVLSLRDLAARCAAGEIPLKKLAGMEDEEVIEKLIPVRGIGRWTAEMFLIFSLGRLDVFPIADYGLRAGVKNQYALDDLPKKDALMKIGDAWKPYRTIGTWFIWRSFGNVPQTKK